MKLKLETFLILAVVGTSAFVYYYKFSNIVRVENATIYTASGQKMENCEIRAYYPNSTDKPLNVSNLDKTLYEVKLNDFTYSCYNEKDEQGIFKASDNAVVLSKQSMPYKYNFFSYKRDDIPKYIGISD